MSRKYAELRGMVCEKVGMLPALNYVEEKNILDRPETRAFVRAAMVDVAVKQENTDFVAVADWAGKDFLARIPILANKPISKTYYAWWRKRKEQKKNSE
eukprot:CAMPEP_0114525912 /NCGR_PEP_ID=MMETSP0109-20121206/22701_1 /TAXON_ID=29199 /ORGANISM="Chlorarachnion reptans, Strain CCCM449" /LENGTH=98 /DNA_ID=CAMNT_0001707573 /DNA_START=269 /DNA_END=566 /DNA_ORIENTATION=+